MNKIENQVYELDAQIGQKVEQVEKTKIEIAALQAKLNSEVIESDQMLTKFSELKKNKELKEIRLQNKASYQELLKAYKNEIKEIKNAHKAKLKELKTKKYSESDQQAYLKLLETKKTDLSLLVQKRSAALSAASKLNKKKIREEFWYRKVKIQKEFNKAIEKLTSRGAIKKENQDFETKLEATFKKHSPKLLAAKNKYLAAKTSISKTLFIILPLIVVPLIMTITLALNYAVYLPAQSVGTGQPKYSPFNQEALPAFIISMALVVLGLITTCVIVFNAKTNLAKERKYAMNKGLFTSIFVGFLELFGVGAFAPTISISNAIGLIEDDKKIPGTLNAGYVLSVVLQALIMISVVKVDLTNLITLIVAAVIGSYLGAMVANKVNKLFIKTAMSGVLLISALLMMLSHPSVQVIKTGVGATGFGLTDVKFYIATIAFLILGILMSFGVGLYAPALAVISLLGMDGQAAYPIMMGACAFLMPVSTFKFVKDKNYAPKLSVALMLGGIFGTFLSFLVLFMGVKYGLGLSEAEFKKILLWIVIVVIFYSSITMFLDSFKLIKKNQNLKFQTLASVYQ